MTPPRKRRLKRILLTIAALVVVVPFVLLHAVSSLFAREEHAMAAFPVQVATDSFGHTVRYYELDQLGAQWNLVYIHGTPGTAGAFREQFRDPFPGANVIAMNRPGFGGSTPVLRRPNLDDQATAVGAVLAHLTNGLKTILIGHSYGAPVAMEAALKFTNQVAGVILIGGSVDPAQEHIYVIQRIADWFLLSWLMPRDLRQCNRELLTLRGDLKLLKTQLPQLTVPVLMLHGVKDDHVPVANVDYLRAQLAAAGKPGLFDKLIFPDYNHFIPWQHPDAVAQAVSMMTNRLAAVPKTK